MQNALVVQWIRTLDYGSSNSGSNPLESTLKIKKMDEKIICPNCLSEENFHFNYDYSDPNLSIIDVMCNNCSEIFDI